VWPWTLHHGGPPLGRQCAGLIRDSGWADTAVASNSGSVDGGYFTGPRLIMGHQFFVFIRDYDFLIRILRKNFNQLLQSTTSINYSNQLLRSTTPINKFRSRIGIKCQFATQPLPKQQTSQSDILGNFQDTEKFRDR
jgi:hypothetical protein